MDNNHSLQDILTEINVNGVSLSWSVFHGRVLGLQRYSKTYVSGGGNVHNGSGSVNIHSTVVTTTEFHVRSDCGQEISHWYTWDNVPLREGQLVTLIYGNGLWLALLNHNLGQWWYMRQPSDSLIGIGAFRWPRYRWFLLLLSPIFLAGLAVPQLIVAGLLAVVAFCWIARTVQRFRIRRAWPPVRTRLNEIARATLKAQRALSLSQSGCTQQNEQVRASH